MRSHNFTFSKIKSNKKGYTLIEVLIVVFMLVALLSIAVGSYSAYYRARGSKVSKTIDTMIAQSKIDALSGRDNIMVIRHQTDFDKSEDGLDASEYYAELYRVEGAKAIRYEKEDIGNSWVSLSLINNEAESAENISKQVSDDNLIVIKFNGKTGAISYLALTDDFSPPSSDEEVNGGVDYDGFDEVPDGQSRIIRISTARPYDIEIWIASGEHIISEYKVDN